MHENVEPANLMHTNIYIKLSSRAVSSSPRSNRFTHTTTVVDVVIVHMCECVLNTMPIGFKLPRSAARLLCRSFTFIINRFTSTLMIIIAPTIGDFC